MCVESNARAGQRNIRRDKSKFQICSRVLRANKARHVATNVTSRPSFPFFALSCLYTYMYMYCVSVLCRAVRQVRRACGSSDSAPRHEVERTWSKFWLRVSSRDASCAAMQCEARRQSTSRRRQSPSARGNVELLGLPVALSDKWDVSRRARVALLATELHRAVRHVFEV